MIYLVRHGRTTFNAEGRLQGGLDSPLTDLGREQADCIGRLLSRLVGETDGWVIQSSSLGRAVHTAQIVCAALGAPDTFGLEPRLAELRMSQWDGLTGPEIEARWPDLRKGPVKETTIFNAPGGEDYLTFSGRLGDWLAEARADHRPRIAISHGVAGRVLRGLYLGLDLADALRQEMPQDAVFCLADGQIERIDCDPGPTLAFEAAGR